MITATPLAKSYLTTSHIAHRGDKYEIATARRSAAPFFRLADPEDLSVNFRHEFHCSADGPKSQEYPYCHFHCHPEGQTCQLVVVLGSAKSAPDWIRTSDLRF
jgi:hypothetical protein